MMWKTPKSKLNILYWNNMNEKEKSENIKYELKYNKKRKGQLIDRNLKQKMESDIVQNMDSIYLNNKRI